MSRCVLAAVRRKWGDDVSLVTTNGLPLADEQGTRVFCCQKLCTHIFTSHVVSIHRTSMVEVS